MYYVFENIYMGECLDTNKAVYFVKWSEHDLSVYVVHAKFDPFLPV